jgi:hypothetical protein
MKLSLSDWITRKFIDSIKLSSWQVETDSGWKDAATIHKTIPYQAWSLKTSKHSLIAADDHIVFKEDGSEAFIHDLKPGDKIKTEDGGDIVLEAKNLYYFADMYDIEVESEDHRFYTNGILSHNTTTYTIFCLWYTTLFPEKKVMICANKLATAIEIMDRIRRAYEYLPSWLKPGVTVYNKSEIVFSNDSSIKAFSTSSSAARGSSGNVIIVDEMAHIPKNIIDEFFASTLPIISSSGKSKAIIVSTPNGASGKFYDLWQEALANVKEKKLNGWKPFQIRWWEAGTFRDEKWKAQQIATVGIEKWKQEYECEFLTSGTKKLIPDDITEQFRMKLSELVAEGKASGKQLKIMSETEDKLYEFTMWHEFDPAHTYAASGDISEGTGGDESVLYVWDISDLADIRMCAEFSSSSVSLVEFAYVASKMLALYNNPVFIAERNGVSSGMLDSLKITYKYPNIVAEGKNGEAGVFSHVQVKGKSCLWAKDMVMTQGFGFTLYDKELLDEFSTFVKKDLKGIHLVYAALPPAHDDHVMSFIWLCYLLQNDIIEKYFIVASTFKDMFGNVRAKIVKSQKDPTSDQIKAVKDSQSYKDFIDFKEKAMSKFNSMKSMEDKDNKFSYSRRDNFEN